MGFANMAIFYLMTFGTILITFGVFPGISRKNLLFGVSVPPAAQSDPDVKILKKAYIRMLLLMGAALTALYIAAYMLFDEIAFTYAMMASTIALITGIAVIYLTVWKRAKALKEQKGWEQQAVSIAIADTSFTKYKISISPLWLLLYPLIIAATVMVGYMMYDKIPDLVPMQMDTAGNVTRYAEKSLRLIYFAPAVQGVMALIFASIYFMIRSTRPELDPENPEVSAKQNAVFRLRWSAFMVCGGALLLLVFLCIQLSVTMLLPMEASFYLSMGLTFLMVAGVVVLAVTTGQSGNRVRLKKTREGGVINRSDDKYWKLGMFYFNPDDPALFVEKRFGVGFTNNFGRPLSWIILLGIIGLVIAIGIVSTKLAG